LLEALWSPKGCLAATINMELLLKSKRRARSEPQLTQIGRGSPKATDYRGSCANRGAAGGVTPSRMVTTSWMEQWAIRSEAPLD
jgi:hypothetical protein